MKSKLLNDLACETVGDGKRPNLYFVTDRGDTVMITSNKTAAYQYWRVLAARRPLQETALEDRLYGVICSVEPTEDWTGAPLRIFDDMPKSVAL